MQQWEEKGYGQGRKKKKSKDVKKATAKRLERLDAVDKPYEPWELRLGASAGRAQRRRRRPARGRPRRARRLSPSARSTSRSAGASGSPSSARTGAARRRCSTRCSVACRSPRARAGPARGVVLGELEQRRETFTGREPLVDAFVRESGFPPEDARTLLAKFDLGADDVLRAAASLSPGERTRAVLALLSARGVNCLVLDEPTNHLDVEAIEELERALAGYDGTVLLVTHDRLFLERFGATRTVAL